MNRRDFLKALGITAAGVAAPKFIFDLGANSRIYTPQTFIPYSLYYLGDSGKYELLDSSFLTASAKSIFIAHSDSTLCDGNHLIVPATGFKVPYDAPYMRVNIAA